jgi:molybdenum cofactor cytidylyltransferase
VVAAPFAERIGAVVSGAQVVENPDPDRGMLSSLQVGLVAALDTTHPPDAVIFSLVDHPRVGADVVRKLVDRFGQTNARVLRPTHAGRAGHPVLIASSVARKLIEISPRTIVREALAQISPAQDLEIDDASILDDADTAEEIRGLRAVLPDE